MNETRTIHRIPLEDVYPSPKQYRKLDKAHVERLAESIGSIGLIQPIEVMQDGGIYYVEAGNHRVAAMKSLELEEVDAIITNGDPEAAAARMVADNIARPDDEVEKARGTQLMFATGVRPEVVAKQVGVTLDQAQAAQRALKLVDEVAVEEHTFDWLLAVDEFAHDKDALERLTKSREDEWRRELADLRRVKERTDNRVHVLDVLDAAGIDYAVGERAYHESAPYIPQGMSLLKQVYGTTTFNTDSIPSNALYADVNQSPNSWETSISVRFYGTPEVDSEEVERQAKYDEWRARIDAHRQLTAVLEKDRVEFVESLWYDDFETLATIVEDYVVAMGGHHDLEFEDDAFYRDADFFGKLIAAFAIDISNAIELPDMDGKIARWLSDDDLALQARFLGDLEENGYTLNPLEDALIAHVDGKEAGDE